MPEQAVILAGGLGTRLYPLTKDLPKPMVPVAGQPFLHWQLTYLREQGIDEVILLIAHLGEVIEKHFKSHPPKDLRLTFVHEGEPLGTGGALRAAQKHLAEEFILLNGDSFLYADLKALHQHCRKQSWKACISTLTDTNLVPVPGNVVLDGDRVARFQKGAGRENGFDHVDAGVYWLNRSLIEASSPVERRFDLETYWPPLIQRGELGAFRVHERFYDIGTLERLKVFEEHLHDYF